MRLKPKFIFIFLLLTKVSYVNATEVESKILKASFVHNKAVKQFVIYKPIKAIKENENSRYGKRTVFNEIILGKHNFWIGGFLPANSEKWQTGVFVNLDTAEPKLLVKGDFGLFLQHKEAVLVVVNETHQHASFATVYALEPNDEVVHLQKQYVHNGILCDAQINGESIYLSGQENDAPFAAEIIFGGSEFKVVPLKLNAEQ